LRDRNDYLALRKKYTAEKLHLIFIAESPPASGKYFYDEEGSVKEVLFKAMINDVLGYSPKDKIDGLKAFRDTGYVLVDATYQPVNAGLTPTQRDKAILSSYKDLIEDLLEINPKKETEIILIKANVCRLLEPLLVDDGFKIRNKGHIIPFPGSGHQRKFAEAIKNLI
jgi:hypothetical protein